MASSYVRHWICFEREDGLSVLLIGLLEVYGYGVACTTAEVYVGYRCWENLRMLFAEFGCGAVMWRWGSQMALVGLKTQVGEALMELYNSRSMGSVGVRIQVELILTALLCYILSLMGLRKALPLG